ncbi:hypothetical protein QN277_019285 [Acacia crassicarpa]|uniref:Retrotransposon gag domain-containing protein n=1 Tax=Acacia crassicarpa TaxID=499986 RepID=A0AAE1MSD5_9FABA|nr:hypothetical protein QN277_019285 [Acacia crassicarpa]
MEFGIPDLNKLNSAITQLTVNDGYFEIKIVMVQMINAAEQFEGLVDEDLHSHLRAFMEICDSFIILRVTLDAIRIKLFPFSLRGKARKWLNNLPANSVTSWEDLGRIFLLHFSPPTRNAQLRKDIASFKQNPKKLAHKAWNQFKNLVSSCPQNGLQEWAQLETFYCGLSSKTQSFVDACANGSILMQPYNKASQLLEIITAQGYQWADSSKITRREVPGISTTDALITLTTKVTTLTNVIDGLISPIVQGNLQDPLTFDHCQKNSDPKRHLTNILRDHIARNNLEILSQQLTLQKLENPIKQIVALTKE